MLKMKQILGDISQMASPPILPISTVEDSMDVDDDSMTTVTLSESRTRNGTVAANARGLPVQDPNLPTREELDELLRRLEVVEAKVDDLTNEINEHQNDVAQIFENEAEKVVENYRAERQIKEDEERKNDKMLMDAEVERANKESVALGKDVEFLGGEVTGLVQKIERLQLQVEQEKKERDVRWMKISQVCVSSSTAITFLIHTRLFSLKNVSEVSN